MASQPDPTHDISKEEDEFQRHFDAFAAGKPVPLEEAPEEQVEPEGNDPEEQVAEVPEKPAAEAEAPSESVTSGEPATGAEAPAAEAPDPWASHPELKALFDAERAAREQAEHKAKSDANRVAALSRKLAMQVPPAPKAPAEEPTEAQKALDEKVKQLRKDYGDIAEPLIELIEQQRSELTSVRSVVETMTEQQQAAVIATETRALEERHPDWRQIAQSPDFAGWLEVQPDNIQRLASSWDARETSVVLTLFKAEQVGDQGQSPPPSPTPAATDERKAEAEATGARRSLQLEGGRDVRSRPAPAASGPPEDFDAAFAYYAEKRKLKT